MTRHDLEADGFTVEKAMMNRKPDPDSITGSRVLNVLILRKGRRQYLTWSPHFPSQHYAEPQMLSAALKKAGQGMPQPEAVQS